VAYLIKARIVEAEEQPLLGNVRKQQYKMYHDKWRTAVALEAIW
jgi:hypothetical protein